MSRVIVYTIDKEGYVVGQFECDREVAIQDYFQQRNDKGFYFIANITDDIPYKFRRKNRKDIRYSSQSQSSVQ